MKKEKGIVKLITKIFNSIKTNKKLVALIISLILVLSLSFSYAWFNGREFRFNTDEKENLATLSSLDGKVDIIGYSVATSIQNEEYLQESIFAVEGSTGIQGAKFIDDDSFIPGALNGVTRLSNEEASIIEENSNTKIIKVTNRSDMDISVKIQFIISGSTNKDLTSFWYLITNVTSDVVNTDISSYPSDGVLTDDTDRKIFTYISNNKSSRSNTYNETNINTRTFDNLTSRVALGEIAEPTSDYTNGNTEYYRIDYGLSEAALRASGVNYFNKNISLDAYIYYGQVNAPDESDEAAHNATVEVNSAEEFLDILGNVNLAYYGDTLKLMDDIDVTPLNNLSSIDITRPLNIDFNNHKLTIHGDFNVTYTAQTDITFDITKKGQLVVYGDIAFTVPNATVNLVGANERAAGESAADIIQYGESTGVHAGEAVQINCAVGQSGDGLNLETIYIVNKTWRVTSSTYTTDNEYIEMQAGSKLTVGENVEISEVSSGEISNVHIYNYGTIGWIHLNSMILANSTSLQIKIYNNGLIKGETIDSNGDAIDHTIDAITLPISSTPANTQIIKGIYSNSFNVSGSENFTSSNITYESTNTQYVTAIKNEINSYRIYIDLSIGKSSGSCVKYALEQYFSSNADSAEAIKTITKLVIESTTDSYLTDKDFTYIKSDALRDLQTLDLSLTNVKDTTVLQNKENRIVSGALRGKVGLTSIILPNTLKYIGQYAFYDTGLTSITIPSSVESIEYGAFLAGQNTTTVLNECIIKAVYPISDNSKFLNAFNSNTFFLVDEDFVDDYKAQFKLKSSFIANHVYCYSTLYDTRYIRVLSDGTIEIVAYTGDIYADEIAPNNIEYEGNTLLVTSIGRDAYINTTNESGVQADIIIGDGITSIGNDAFNSVTSIKSIFTTSCTSIGKNAFKNCQALVSIVIGGTDTIIGESAFYNDAALEDIRMNNAKYIGDNAFSGCKKIKNLSIPNVTYIGSNAFYGCTSFESIEFGSIETISDNTFYNCKALHTLGLSSTTKTIGDNAFYNCISLKTVYPYGESEKIQDYAYFKYVETIGEKAFYNCTSLIGVYFDNIDSIGSYAFYNCNNLLTVDMETVTSIGSYAFKACPLLSNANMDSVITIGSYAFENDSNLQYAFIGNATAIGISSFYNCSGIEAIELGNATIGSNAFVGVYPKYVDLSSYTLPSDYATTSSYITFGGNNLWHRFTITTKYYFESTGDSSIDSKIKQYFYRILKNSVQNTNISTVDRNLIYAKDTFLGDNLLVSTDYDTNIDGFGSRTYLGLVKNIYLYNVKLNSASEDIDGDSILDTTATILSYHGPKLIGNVVIPFSTYSNTGISDSDFEIAKVSTNNYSTYHITDLNNNPVYVTAIGEYAFYAASAEGVSDSTFSNITFGSTVKRIMKGAFQSSKINFLYCNQVEVIEASAFRTNTVLRFVDLGEVTTIGNYAFSEVKEQQDINGNSISDGSDITQYFSYGNNSISFTETLLTKVIFRHVDTIGEAAFCKYGASSRKTKLLILDMTSNIPDSSSTSGFGPNDNINVPTNVAAHWMGPPVNESGYYDVYSYNDTFVLVPYYEEDKVAIESSFKKFTKTDQMLYDYGYWVNPDYEVNDVKVGMFMLKPAESGNTDDGFYLYKSFIRELGKEVYNEIGTYLKGLTPAASSNLVEVTSINATTSKVARIKFTIPSSFYASEITVTNGTTLTKADPYVLRLSNRAFANTSMYKNIYGDLAFGDNYVDIPNACFAKSAFRDIYTNNIETIDSYAFRSVSIGTIYCYHVEEICDYFNLYGSIQIIDVRDNTYKADVTDDKDKIIHHAGDLLVIDFGTRFLYESKVTGIYVTSDEYEEYRTETEKIVIYDNDYDSEYETDIELYLYVLVPGVYIGELNLLNTETYDLKGLIAPYTTESTDVVTWKVFDETPNSTYSNTSNYYATVTDGIVDLTLYSGRPLTTGTFYVVCYKEYNYQNGANTSKDLLCKFKVNILSEGDTSITYYDIENDYISVKDDDNTYHWVSSVKVLKYYGTIEQTQNTIFNPSTELTSYLDNIITRTELSRFTNTNTIFKYLSDYTRDDSGEYKVIEIGVGAYYSMELDPSLMVYLVTDNCLDVIDDYSFYRVAFYEAWLMNVTSVGRKSFTNGSTQNNLVKVVMPSIKEIGYSAFSHNRQLVTVVIGDNYESIDPSKRLNSNTEIMTIDDYAFYACNKLEKLGVVRNDLSQITTSEIIAQSYILYFLKDYTDTTVVDPDTLVSTTTSTYEYYSDTDKFIYLPDTLRTSGAYAFYQTILIKEIRLPENYYFNTIESYEFAYCRALEFVRMNSRILYIENYAFYQCDSLGDYTTVTTIDPVDSSEIVTPVSGIDFTYVREISDSAFKQCYALREIHFGDIESIGKQAFYMCSNLRFIYFDEVVTYEKVTFGTNWDSECHSLLRCYVSDSNKTYFADAGPIYYKEAVAYTDNGNHEYVINYIKNGTGLITGIKIACYNGVTDPNVSDDNVLEQIPATLFVEGTEYTVVSIGEYAYKGFTLRTDALKVETIELPETVKEVSSYAFCDCQFTYYVELLTNTANIQEVTYGDGVFKDNVALKSAIFNRMASGGSKFFDGCSNMKTMNLENNVNKYNVYTAPIIADDFFSGARSDLTCSIRTGTLSLFTQIGYIGKVYQQGDTVEDYTLVYNSTLAGYEIIRYNVTAITSDYTVPTEVAGRPIVAIGPSAYTSIAVSQGLTLTIPQGISKIDTYAFYELGFKYIVINATNITFGDYVFMRSTNLISADLSSLTSLTGTGVFQDSNQLITVNISTSVTEIPDYYFSGCTNIVSFDLLNVKTIGAYAFSGCTTLQSMNSSTTVGSSLVTGTLHFGQVETIKEYAFNGCANIRVINPSNVTSIGKYAFKGATSVTEVKETLEATTVSEGAFYGLTSLTGVILKYKVVPDYCFYGCTSLRTVRFDKVTSVGNYAFYNDSAITSIDLSNCLSVGNYAFYNCNQATSLDLGRTNYIGNYAFNLCKSITSLDLKNVETIGNYAFNNCNITGTLDLKNVKYIGTYTFANNIYLTEVLFKRVMTLGAYVFYNDVRLTSFNFSENGELVDGSLVYKCPTTVNANVFSGVSQSTPIYLIYVPVDDSVLLNQYRTKFSYYKPYIFEYGYMSTENSLYMVKDNSDSTLTIIRYFGDDLDQTYQVPSKLDNKVVSKIGDYAYYSLGINDYDIEKLNLGLNIVSVGDYAFYSLDFEVLSMPSVTDIGKYAFSYNDTLSYLSLTSVINVNEYAFYNNSALQVVRFYDSIRYVGDHAFDSTEELRSVYFVNIYPSVITINNNGYVFGLNTNTELTIRVPGTVVSSYKAKLPYYQDLILAGKISDADFSYRENDTGIEIISYEGQDVSVTIPDTIDGMNVVRILEDAFINALNVESITLPSTLTSISSHAFYTNSTIKHVYVTSGTNNVFVSVDDCLYMKDSQGIIKTLVYYPVKKTDTVYSFTTSTAYDLSNVERIYENAFYGNKIIEEINIPSTVKYIGEGAFSETPNLLKVTIKAPTTGTATVVNLYGTNIFSQALVDNFEIYVPSSILNLYLSDKYFGYYKKYIKPIA